MLGSLHSTCFDPSSDEVKANCAANSKHGEQGLGPLNEWLVHSSHTVNVALGYLHCSGAVGFIGAGAQTEVVGKCL